MVYRRFQNMMLTDGRQTDVSVEKRKIAGKVDHTWTDDWKVFILCWTKTAEVKAHNKMLARSEKGLK